MPRPKIHLICNAHLDPVWLWEWEEGAAEAHLDLPHRRRSVREFDGFVFNHNEVILYRWVEEYEPELFARIQRLVSEGRWHIMGGWHLQPDCNMPSGESFVRQIAARASATSARSSASTPTTAINFDPFGHTRGLVQILAKCGYDSYLFCRPGQDDCRSRPTISLGRLRRLEVMATRAWPLQLAACGGARKKVEQWLGDLPDEPRAASCSGAWATTAAGPRARTCATSAALIDRAPTTSRSSTPRRRPTSRNSARQQAHLPRTSGDLNPWAVGCYTSQVRIKQKHRRLENELYIAGEDGLRRRAARD